MIVYNVDQKSTLCIRTCLHITSKTVDIAAGVKLGDREQAGTIYYTYTCTHEPSVTNNYFQCHIGLVTWVAPLISPTQYNTNGTVYFMPSPLYYFDNFIHA